MFLLIKYISKIRIHWLANLLTSLAFLNDVLSIIAFFICPFIKYNKEFLRITFLVFWIYTAVIFLISMLYVMVAKLKTDKKDVDNYSENRFLYFFARTSVLIIIISALLIVFLCRNNFIDINILTLCYIIIIGHSSVTFVVILLIAYKDNYKKLLTDILLFSAIIICFSLIFHGILINDNDEFSELQSKLFIGTGCFTLSFIFIGFVYRLFMSATFFDEETDGFLKSIFIFISLGIVSGIILRYLVTDSKLQEIMTAIIAAVLGGTITLAGVAVTIKKGAADRQNDLERHEKEKTEVERKKYIPHFNVWTDDYTQKCKTIYVEEFPESFQKNGNKNLINEAIFLNTEFCDFYVWGVIVNESQIKLKRAMYIRKDEYFKLFFKNNYLPTNTKLEKLSLILEDFLGNLYEMPLIFEKHSYLTYDIIANGRSELLTPKT